MSDLLIQDLTQAGRALQQPLQRCGEAPGLGADELIAATHRVWKALHLKAIGEIITIDTIEEKHKEAPINPHFVAYLSHIRQAWRKVNDVIVWHLCGGHRHVVKRV